MAISYQGAIMPYAVGELQPLNTHLAEQTLHELLAMRNEGRNWGYGRIILLEDEPLIDDGTHRAFLHHKERQERVLASTYNLQSPTDVLALALMQYTKARERNRSRGLLSDEEFQRLQPKPQEGDERFLRNVRQSLCWARNHGVYRLADLEDRIIPYHQSSKRN